MRFVLKTSVLLLSVLAFVCVAAYGMYRDEEDVLGVETLSRLQWDQVIAEREQKDLNITLRFNGKTLDKAENIDAYLITQSLDTQQWQGILSVESDYALRCLQPEKKKAQMIADGEAIRLLVYDNESYDMVSVIPSGLPIIYMHTETDVDGREGTGSLTVLENNAMGRENVVESRVFSSRYRKRGGSSRLSEKTAWKINLLDHWGGRRAESLLGMENDHDWILNPLYSDLSCMRERLAYDMWALMGGENQHQSAYCELIFDEEYQGVYLMMEAVDRKTYDLTAQECYLYSIKDWAQNHPENVLFSEDVLHAYWWYNGRIDEFSIDDLPEGKEEEAISLLAAFKAQNSSIDDSGAYEFVFDEDNLVRYGVFLNLIRGGDNRYKNQKFILAKETENRYRISKTPWDLDMTMMNETVRTEKTNVGGVMNDGLLLGRENDQHYMQAMQELYWQCRETFYEMRMLEMMIDGYKDLLVRTGAAGREQTRWNEPDFPAACEYLKTFFDERIQALDAYYGS